MTSAVVAVSFFEAVDGGDVRMIQRGEDFRFALEPGEPLGIGRDRVGQDLDRDVPLQPRVGGAIDLAHPAGADVRGFRRGRGGAGRPGPLVLVGFYAITVE